MILRALIFFLCICWQVFAEEPPKALFLTWQHSPESSMTILWVTPLNQVQDQISFRADSEEAWQSRQGTHSQLPENTPYALHTIELTNLQPDKTYLFRINDQEKIYKFRTLPHTLSAPLKFVVGGDMYHDDLPTLRGTNQRAALTGPQFVIVGGDIAYASGWGTGFLPKWLAKMTNSVRNQTFDRWLEWLQAWSQDMVTPDGFLIPMLPVIGNHDVIGGFDQTPLQAPFFYALFPMPGFQGYNVVDFGNYMTILLLDSGHTHPVAGAQAAWVKSTLEARQNVPTKIAVYHVPAYPSVRHPDYGQSKLIRETWVPAFDMYHLTLAFEHHDHDYKRTFPLTNGEVNPEGVTYLGDGAWGVKDPRQPKKPTKRGYLAKTAQARHFILVELSAGKTTVSAITDTGTVIDTSTR